MCTPSPIGRLFLEGTVDHNCYFAISGEFTSISKRAGVEEVLECLPMCLVLVATGQFVYLSVKF